MATGAKKRSFVDSTREDEQVFVSSPIYDRASTFVAHYHPHLSSGGGAVAGSKSTSLTSTIKSLQSHSAFEGADHRMVGWRRKSSQRTLTMGLAPTAGAIYTTGSDDDGENYAGRKLEKVLEAMDVEGAVVVARWYGGVLLGPVRFTHIENAAREAIGKFKRATATSRPEAVVDAASKRPKLDDRPAGVDDEAERSRLAKQLAERDRSIVVLRGLLAEKTAAKSNQASQTPEEEKSVPTDTMNAAADPAPSTTPSPAKQIDYTVMPIARLRQLEKARDASIAFILKQLDKADEEEKKTQAQETEQVTSAGVT